MGLAVVSTVITLGRGCHRSLVDNNLGGACDSVIAILLDLIIHGVAASVRIGWIGIEVVSVRRGTIFNSSACGGIDGDAVG